MSQIGDRRRVTHYGTSHAPEDFVGRVGTVVGTVGRYLRLRLDRVDGQPGDDGTILVLQHEAELIFD